ncbi:MAG TPA: hypothetical protein VLT35_07800, partial [Methanocella sp.]|nr:hypothetical protein [Methanocella sp.]
VFERYDHLIRSNLLVTINVDFTPGDRCQVDIISGGGEEGLLHFTPGTEKSAVVDLIRIFTQVGEANGWHVEEYESGPDKGSG